MKEKNNANQVRSREKRSQDRVRGGIFSGKRKRQDDIELSSEILMDDSIEPERRKKKKNPNREIILITYVFVGLFLLLVGYFTYYLIVDSEDVINNSYNKRQDLLAERVHRGKILGNDGEVLAETIEKGEESQRVYPYKNMFAHIVGRFDKGRTGLESTENFRLLTSNTNPIKKILGELSGEKSPGDNVVTTLDVNLQKIAYDALGNRKGAVVILEPDTGKILAMVSKPDYDPNRINTEWQTLTEDKEKKGSLLNRATQEWYPPGSTFKILTALEYIRENPGYKDYTFDCEGKGIFDNVLINCYNNRVHGEEDLKESFAKSCNASFANIGMGLNLNSYRELCESFLFNKELPTTLPYKMSSFELNGKSDKSEVPQTAIGQGNTLITPFHNALIAATIANDGVMMNPYLVDHIENSNGDTVKKYLPTTYGKIITSKESKLMTKYMEEVVQNGTATALKSNKYSAAGKTGSAEYATGKPAHAWFVGFASDDNPKIAVSIIVESVGTGSEYAVPIAKKIFDAYFMY